MALTPQYDDELLVVVESDVVEPEPSKTWELDFSTGRVRGFIDEEKAIRQFVLKALMTERYKYVIYSDNYGNELKTLIGSGMSRALLASEIPRMIQDAIEYDDRIESALVNLEFEGDKAFVTVTVETIKGETVTEEVGFNV